MPAYDMLLSSTREMARELSVTPATLLRWSQTDKAFPQPIRIGTKSLRWDRGAVLGHLADLRRKPRAGEAK
jgi:predicted DNA-binding transcriptional regulator AlpA